MDTYETHEVVCDNKPSELTFDQTLNDGWNFDTTLDDGDF